MTPAHYIVIRYIADPGRSEALNVGIVIWDDKNYRLSIDSAAVARVVRENPWLASDALLYLEAGLREQIDGLGPFTDENMKQFLDAQKGFPVLLTEPRFAAIPDDEPSGIDGILRQLIKRIVHPRRRSGPHGVDPVRVLQRRFQPLLQQHLVSQNHMFIASRTGVRRTVDFYANSGANIVLDTVRLSLARADSIRERADAEAFKIEDITAMNDLRVIVYAALPSDTSLAGSAQEARHIIETAGAKVVTDIDEAVRDMTRAVGYQPSQFSGEAK